MIRSGFGIHLSADGTMYSGNWENDQMNGSGQIQFASGAAYVGEFVNNCFFGKGQYMWPNGSNFDGQFANNRFLLLFLILFYQLTNFYLRKKARSLLCQHGWVTGCLSATRRYCIKMVKPILTLFQPSDSPSFSFLLTPCAVIRFQG